MLNEKTLIQHINDNKGRSKWDNGVTSYALDILEDIDLESIGSLGELTAAMLNGAKDWKQYSYGGGALVYDGDIAAMLCTASELKRTNNGERNPNARENWLDVQARALYQAAAKIRNAARVQGLR